MRVAREGQRDVKILLLNDDIDDNGGGGRG